MNDATGKNFIDLTASIVSAYLSNNPTPASEIPALISQIHAALLRVSGGRIETPLEPAKPAVSIKKSMTPDYLVCLEDGKRFKSLKRHSAHAIQHDAGAVPGQMGPCGRLSDGGAELRRRAVAACQENGTWPAAAATKIVRKYFRGKRHTLRGDAVLTVDENQTVRTPRQATRGRRCVCDRPWRAGRWSAAASDVRENRIRRIPRSHRWKGSAAACVRNSSVSRIAISPRTICASLSPR